MSRAAHAAGLRDAGVLFATRVGVYAAAIASQGLLAWLLRPEGRGAYAVCVAFAYLFGVAATLSAEKGAQFLIAAGRLDLSRGVMLALGACLAGSAAAAVAALPLIHSGLAYFRQADTASFELALVLVPAASMSFAASLQLAGLRRFAPLAAFSLAQPVVAVAGLLVLVRHGGMGVDGAILALAAGHVVLLLGCLWDLRRNCGLTFAAPSPGDCRRVLGYGLRHHAARVGTELEPHIGVAALGALAAGRADIGLFAAAAAVIYRLTAISFSVATALFPRIAGGEGAGLETVGLCLRLVCAATAVALALLLAAAEPLVRVLFSAAFLPVVPLFWIMAPGVLAHAAAGVFVAWFNGVGRPGVCSWTIWLGLAAYAAAFAVLYPTLGAPAAAWALAAGTVLRAVVLAAAFHRATGASPRGLWLPRREDFARLWRAGRALATGLRTTRTV